MDSGKWAHVVQLTVLLGGGVACFFLGQPQLGTLLVGAAVGNASPQTLLPVRQPPVIGLPPFYQGNPTPPPPNKEKTP